MCIYEYCVCMSACNYVFVLQLSQKSGNEIFSHYVILNGGSSNATVFSLKQHLHLENYALPLQKWLSIQVFNCQDISLAPYKLGMLRHFIHK